MKPDQIAPETRLVVTGMTCGKCVKAVTEAALKIGGVAEADVRLPDSAVIRWNEDPTADRVASVVATIAEAGYQARVDTGEVREPRNETPKKSGAAALPSLTVLADSGPVNSLPKLPIVSDHLAADVAANPAPIPADSTAPSQNWELSVSGMHCASCVGRVEKALAETPGVRRAVVNLATERATITVDPESTRLDRLRMNVKNAGYDIVKIESTLSAADQADTLRRERSERIRGWRRRLFAGLIFGLPLLFFAHGPGHSQHPGSTMRLGLVALAGVTTILVGLPFFRSAWTLARHGSSNMDTLVSLGSAVAFGFGTWMTLVPEHPQTHFLADGVIILLMITFGKWLEARSKGNAADALESLMDLSPRRVRAVRASGSEIEIDQEDLRVGMAFRVRPGEAIATDGEVIEGSADVDESMLTGESLPVHKKPGAKLIGGSRCLDGTLLVRATGVGTETVLAGIIDAVKRAQSSKASMQKLVDKVAAVFVPAVIVIASVTLMAWGLIGRDWSGGVLASAAVLLISCPCALGLATPMAISVGSSRAARMGLIVRDAGVFERCDKLDHLMFDKTGTLTEGKPRVVEVHTAEGISREDCLTAAAAIERFSEHPLAKAIVAADSGGTSANVNVTDFRNDRGHGVEGIVGGRRTMVGSLKWMKRQGVTFPAAIEPVIESWTNMARSIAGVARDGVLVGLIALEDSVRPSAAAAVERLTRMDLNVGVISGDRASAVRALAEQLRIPLDDLYAEMAPEEKSGVLMRLRQNGSKVAMVGDGLNDAPALAAADVSMALASGTDVAKNAADIVVVGSDLDSVADAVALSRATLATIRQNLFWAFAYNVVAIPLAAFGMFDKSGPLIASVAMAGSSLTVVARSLWLGRQKLG
ncbi:heavy metal translocating P-type ATPase [bacterium]|nr:heavy metal translocating P-type ATPase [bacterium]